MTIDAAEALVVDARAQLFPGTLMVSAVWEDEEYFAIAYAAREYVVDGDPAYQMIGALPDFVSKAQGAIVDPPGLGGILDINRRLAQMTLVLDNVGSAQPA